MSAFVAVIGEAAEIKAYEKSMRRAWQRDASNIWPSHLDHPHYNPSRLYGIVIEEGERHDTYYVATANTLLRTILENGEWPPR